MSHVPLFQNKSYLFQKGSSSLYYHLSVCLPLNCLFSFHLICPLLKVAFFDCRFQDICEKKVSVPFMTIMKDISQRTQDQKETTVNKLQDYQLDPVLSQYFNLPQVLKYVGCFTGQDIMAVHTMLINKVIRKLCHHGYRIFDSRF